MGADPAEGTEDLERGLRPTTLARLPVIGVVLLVTLLLFNSQGLVAWSQRLPSSDRNDWIATVAADWHDVMLKAGLAQPMMAIRARLENP